MNETNQTISSFHRLLWAKTTPYKQLLAHMIDAGCCAKVYLGSAASAAILSYLSDQWNCSNEAALQFVSYLVALHDIGKATPHFQMQNEEQYLRLKASEIGCIFPLVKPNSVRHEYLSQKIASRIWKQKGINRRLYDAYSCVLSLHHQKANESQSKKTIFQEEWILLQNNIEERLRETFGFFGDLPVPKQMDPVCILLTGILILCDWVASSGPFAVLDGESEDYYVMSLDVAQQAMRQYGLISESNNHEIESFHMLWPNIIRPRDIQSKCDALSASAPLTIIEAPMGEGKTEAALYMATRCAQEKKKRGMYVALPTQATSNQMYRRFSSMLANIGNGYVRLLHGTAFLMKGDLETIQSEDRIEAEKWLGTSRMGLLDENGVGTVDQAMGAVLIARFSVLRLLGLVNKALIIDELHAYDAYMSEIIESLLHWCRVLSIPVILLSATLTDSQRRRYLSCFVEQNKLPELSKSYPLITQVTDEHSIMQTEADASMQTGYSFIPVAVGQDEKSIAGFAMNRIKDGGCYCILVNTVKQAQKIYKALQEMADPGFEILLFHARFTMGDRQRLENECLRKFGKDQVHNRPEKAILVATQVVEQSLDIDFDGMISELAPIDLLLQRAGRVHRHRDRIRPRGLEKPEIHVILPNQEATEDLSKRYGSSGYIYAPFLLYNTEKLLENGIIINVPRDVRGVIAEVYESVSDENRKAWLETTFSQQLMTANADKISFPWPKADTFFPAQSYPEFEDINIDDGFDTSLHATTRLGEPTFRIAFTSSELLNAAKQNHLSNQQQQEILLSSVSLRLTPDIKKGLDSANVYQIRKGPLVGCYITDKDDIIPIGDKKLVNDPVIGIYWEE